MVVFFYHNKITYTTRNNDVDIYKEQILSSVFPIYEAHVLPEGTNGGELYPGPS